jgi:hypothetical protein
MANALYLAILNRIRRIPSFRPGARPRSLPGAQPIIPFAPGRIYATRYTNYKHDPKPLIFILSSSAFYTNGINIHYLGGMQGMLMRIILSLRASNQSMGGMIMYKFLKQRAPAIPKMGYRMYFTKYFVGRLVSDGVSQIPSPDKDKFVSEPFVNALNKMIRPRVINKVRMTNDEAMRLASEMNEAKNDADRTIIGRR